MSMHGSSSRRLAAPVIATGGTLALTTLLILAVGSDPVTAYAALIDGALGGPGLLNLQATANRAAMIVGMALAAGLALRCGFLNIGGEGQMVLGGVTAALVAAHVPLPPVIGVPLVLACAALAGGLWAYAAALMQLRLGISLLIASLLLNYPAIYLASWLVNHPFRDISGGMPASHRVPPDLRLPMLGNMQVSVLLVILLAAALAVFFRRTVAGYEARMTGAGPEFARASGIAVDRLGTRIVSVSGAIAGLIGALAVLGEQHRYIDGMLVQPLYAWTGIMAVLLGGRSLAAVVLAGGFFAALSSGAMGMERAADVPREIARIVLACIILMVAARGAARLSQRDGEARAHE